jgi:short-subunit dehydrogenase
MKNGSKHILISGATGGIGSATARQLAARGHRLTLVARDPLRLQKLIAEDLPPSAAAIALPADLTRTAEIPALIAAANRQHGPIDALINNAAVNWFGRFEAMPGEEIDRLLQTDLAAPLHLTRAVLPQMLHQGYGRIVNVGSVFGGIGFAGFAVYSSCKFALRGFSEALRREVSGSGVSVIYVAPRYTTTAFNDGPVARMAAGIGLAMDQPTRVAARIVAAMDGSKAETTIGWPERFFVKLNAVLPRLVDRGTAKTSRQIMSFTADGQDKTPAPIPAPIPDATNPVVAQPR